MRLLFLSVLFSLSILVQGQDTITFLQYNLLNYGNITSYCTENNNNVEDKDRYINTILSYVQPDVFMVNEVGASQAIHQRLLDRAVNADGTGKYRMANFIYESSPYLVNLLFYNHEKLALHSHVIAQSYVRDIDVYKLYYKSSDLADGDTAFITCIVAHLKAGSNDEDAVSRNIMARNTLMFLEDYGPVDNYLMSGDFNLYTSSEAAYQTLLQYQNPDVRFIDPIDSPGAWNNNGAYAGIHTQSTHTTSNGCPSTGGLDDRFDFILMSNSIREGSRHFHYLSGSYKTIGQDGLHFNTNLLAAPTNTSVPADVLTALYNNSDHLPVSLKLIVDKTLGIRPWEISAVEDLRFQNPVIGDQLPLQFYLNEPSKITISLVSMTGQILISEEVTFQSGEQSFILPVSNIKGGLYFVRVSNKQHGDVTKKLICL